MSGSTRSRARTEPATGTRPSRGGYTVSHPYDAAERQADRAAEVVAGGGSVTGWSFATLAASAPASHLHRQESGKPKSAAETKKEALETAAKAALETPAGKKLRERILDDPLVKSLKDAATSPAGIAVGATAAAGGVAALAATGKALPFQPPAIPLDTITPGLSAQVTYEGPVNAPTRVGLTLTYKEQGPKAPKGPSATENYRAETARLAAEQARFRAGLRFTPGSREAEQQQAEQAAIARFVATQSGLPGFGRPLIPLTGGPVTLAAPPTPQEKSRSNGQEKQQDEDGAPLQREAASEPGSSSALDTGRVDAAVDGTGRELDPSVRHSMEARFGYDFSSVRIHDDAAATAAARDVHATAFTVGHDIVFAPGGYDPASPQGRRLLAHELAHVVQQRGQAHHRLHRAPGGGQTSATPQRKDYEEFVDAAVRYLRDAADYYGTLASSARLPAGPQPPGRAPAGGRASANQPGGRLPGETAPGTGHAAPPAAAGLEPARLEAALTKLRETYDSAREINDSHLDGGRARADRLREAYGAALDAARSAAADSGRVNIVLIAAPKDRSDGFIANATTYATLYMHRVAKGDTVTQAEGFDSPEALFDAIEKAEPNRMIRRVDVFCHGTIEPTHQMKFGNTWFRLSQIREAAAKRAAAGSTIASQTRFDGSTVIEFHACRLGAPKGEPGTSGEAVSSGEEFLTGVGAALGGERGQQVVGYEQRWVPRRFTIPGVRSTASLKGARAAAFDRIAVQVFDALAGSFEIQTRLTEAELAGAAVTRARKVEIMRTLYDAAGGAWLIGHQYSTAVPQSTDPVRDVPGKRDTFTNERDWQHLVLKVRVPATLGSPKGVAP